MIITRELLEILLENAVSAAPVATGPLATTKVLLFVNQLVPDVDTVLGDLTEAAFTGYARSGVVTWAVGGAINSSEVNTPVIVGDGKLFTCTGTAVEETVTGYALIDETPTPDRLLAVQMLDTAEEMFNGESIIITPRFNLRSDSPTPSGDVTVT